MKPQIRVVAGTAALALLLLLSGCDGTLVGPEPAFQEAPHQAAKTDRSNNILKPHALSPSVLRVRPAVRGELLWGLVAPMQRVDVVVNGEDSAEGTFRAWLYGLGDGQAQGNARLGLRNLAASSGLYLVFDIAFSGATLHADDGRRIVAFRGTADICSQLEGHDRETTCYSTEISGEVTNPIILQVPEGVHAGIYVIPAQTRFFTPRTDSGSER
jgi:hypothetical protein